MKTKISKIIILTLTILLSGCAMYYRPISPEKLNYNILDKNDGVEFSYRYDVLKERGNKKMGKKEEKSDVKIIAVRITNKSDSIICIGKDVAFYSGLNQLPLLSPDVVKNKVKQSVLGYTPYFIGVLGYTGVNINGQQSFNFGLILWPAIAIGNMLVANNANSNLLKELIRYDITDMKIKPGETVYGIIGIQDTQYIPLTLRKISSVQKSKI